MTTGYGGVWQTKQQTDIGEVIGRRREQARSRDGYGSGGMLEGGDRGARAIN